jgi:hypothetical protein
MYLVSCGSFLHESMSMEDQVLAKHRFIQYIPTYSLTLQFTCRATFSVTTHSLQMITCRLVSTSSIGRYEANVQEHECIQKLSTKILNVQYRRIGCLVTDITSQTIWRTAHWSIGPLIYLMQTQPTKLTNHPRIMLIRQSPWKVILLGFRRTAVYTWPVTTLSPDWYTILSSNPEVAAGSNTT